MDGNKNIVDSLILPMVSLWWREMIRFYRQKSRVVGALGTPLVFWLLIGSGLGTSFQSKSTQSRGGYLEYFYPGTLTLILLFTAIFSTISIIEDRREGFLQGVLVAPINRSAIVLGKILGGTSLALQQGILFLLLSPTIGISLHLGQIVTLVAIMFLVAFGLTGIGFLIAWPMESTQGFHAIMNLFLIPMWILSGALFPASGAPGWLRSLMALNPLTYGLAAIRQLLFGTDTSTDGYNTLSVSFTVILVFCLLTFGLSFRMANRPMGAASAGRASARRR